MKRFEINLDSNMEQLDGTPVKDERQQPLRKSIVLASSLMQAKVQDNLILKYYTWAKDLKDTGKLLVDKADKDDLLAFINTQGMVVLFAAPIREAIVNATEVDVETERNVKKVK